MGMMTFRPGQRLVIPGAQVYQPRPSAAAVGGILDGISNLAAYGLRKLRSAYAGSAVRVRRSSDSTEQDIGFDGTGEFDSAAFTSFVGVGTGYVKTWYDQSGNARDATQATAGSQPAIALAAMNGKAVARFDGVNDFLVMSSAVSPGANTVFAIAANLDYPGVDPENYLLGNDFGDIMIFGYDDDTRGIRAFVHNGGFYFDGNKRADIGNTPIILSLQATSSTNRVYNNGAQQGSTLWTMTISWSYIQRIGAYALGRYYDGDMAEIVILSASSTTDHNTIGSNMATRYGLTWTTVT